MRQFLTAFLWTLKNCDICDNCNTNFKIPYFQNFKSFFSVAVAVAAVAVAVAVCRSLSQLLKHCNKLYFCLFSMFFCFVAVFIKKIEKQKKTKNCIIAKIYAFYTFFFVVIIHQLYTFRHKKKPGTIGAGLLVIVYILI